MSLDANLDATVAALHAAVEASFDHYVRMLMTHTYGPRASFALGMRATLRRRVKYGGRKGRRAALRLAGKP